MNYSKGITWFDDCRIPFVDDDTTRAGKRTCNIFETEYKSGGNGSPDYHTNPLGRFPANLLCSDDVLNDGTFNKGGTVKPHKKTTNTTFLKSEGITSYFKGDNGSNSRYYDIDKWFEQLINELYLLE